MRKKYLPVFLLLLILSLTLVLFKEEIVLGRLLKDVKATVYLDEKAYQVNGGNVMGMGVFNNATWLRYIESTIRYKDTKNKVLRLALFYLWTKEDPLFTSPDLNTEELAKSVKILSEEHQLLLKKINQTTPLYPVDFLQQLAEVSRLTAQFLDKPSLDKAQELLVKQESLVQTYQTEAQGLLSAVPDEEVAPISLNIKITRRVTHQDLGRIIQNAQILKEEIQKRRSCLEGKGECTRPALSFTKPAGSPMQQKETPQLLDKKMLFRDETDEIRGPYLSSTPCFGATAESDPYYFYLQQIESKDNKISALTSPYLNIELAAEVYFRRLRSDLPADIKQRKMMENGARYTRISSTNPYFCPNREYLVEVSQVDLFLRQKKPILGEEGIEKDSAILEKQVFSSPYLSYQNLELLADHYGFLYRVLAENPGSSWAKGRGDLKEELLQRYLTIKRKLGSVHLLFNNTIRHIAYSRLKLNFKPSSLLGNISYFYTNRNFYGLFYLPFTASVYRSSEPLQYLERIEGTGIIGLDGGFVTYHQALEKYLPSEIDKWFLENPEYFIEELGF